MAVVVKSCDYPAKIALKVFEMLNYGNLEVQGVGQAMYILTDVEPKDLKYPEGWYYAKGNFRNKHTSSTGVYSEIIMIKKTNNTPWYETAKYSTL